MQNEDQERLAELEELLDFGEELSEEDREELTWLRSTRRQEKKEKKLIAQFQSAKRVWRYPDPDGTADGYCYALSRQKLREMLFLDTDPDQGTEALIEEVDRPVLDYRIGVDEFYETFAYLPKEA